MRSPIHVSLQCSPLTLHPPRTNPKPSWRHPSRHTLLTPPAKNLNPRWRWQTADGELPPPIAAPQTPHAVRDDRLQAHRERSPVAKPQTALTGRQPPSHATGGSIAGRLSGPTTFIAPSQVSSTSSQARFKTLLPGCSKKAAFLADLRPLPAGSKKRQTLTLCSPPNYGHHMCGAS